MNDLRLMLLGIGLFVIVFIYLWGTLKQKSQNLAWTRKFTDFNKNGIKNVKIIPTYEQNDEISMDSLAELDTFLDYHESPDSNIPDFSLRTKTDGIYEEKIGLPRSSSDKFADSNTRKASHNQIIVFLIKASPGKDFSGVDILKAIDISGLKFGNMNVFHYHGMAEMESRESIFSLASMYEPGYFELDKMETYQTKGLTLFMQLPTPIDNMLAFSLMQETAMKFTDMLKGELCSSKHNPMNESELQAMRDVISEFP